MSPLYSVSGTLERRRTGLLAMFLFALVCLFVATGNARADGDSPATGAGGLANPSGENILGTAPSVDPGPPPVPQPAEPGPAPATDSGQQASTEQEAASNAEATQDGAFNLVISLRIDSPGDDGPITQANVVAAVARASNDGATTQLGAPGTGGGNQQASTGQTAGSGATVTQNHVGNIVISIRINSPGNSGAIGQTNGAAASSNAGNASGISQGAPPRAGGADETSADPQRDPPMPIGPPGVAIVPPSEPAPPAPAPVAASAALKAALPSTHPARRAAHVSLSATPLQVARTTGPSSRTTGPSPARPAHSRAATSSEPMRPVVTRPGARSARPATRPTALALAGRGASHTAALLGSLASRTALASGEESPGNVTTVVLMTLLAVLGAFIIFTASQYLPPGSRLLDPRYWLRG